MLSSIRKWLLARVRNVLVHPEALPPEAEHFAGVLPNRRLGEAGKRAAIAGKHVLDFVYDPSQPERGQLDHGLRNFLENRRTRDTMNGVFVTALVPLSQVAGRADILKDMSMERSRWIVFDADLNAVEQAEIYANGAEAEAEKVMIALAAKYPPRS